MVAMGYESGLDGPPSEEFANAGTGLPHHLRPGEWLQANEGNSWNSKLLIYCPVCQQLLEERLCRSSNPTTSLLILGAAADREEYFRVITQAERGVPPSA